MAIRAICDASTVMAIELFRAICSCRCFAVRCCCCHAGSFCCCAISNALRNSRNESSALAASIFGQHQMELKGTELKDKKQLEVNVVTSG